jgi:hypothetical protein
LFERQPAAIGERRTGPLLEFDQSGSAVMVFDWDGGVWSTSLTVGSTVAPAPNPQYSPATRPVAVPKRLASIVKVRRRARRIAVTITCVREALGNCAGSIAIKRRFRRAPHGIGAAGSLPFARLSPGRSMTLRVRLHRTSTRRSALGPLAVVLSAHDSRRVVRSTRRSFAIR